MSFEQFMTKQCAEMCAYCEQHPGETPEQWIEQHAAEFRVANPVEEDTE